MPQQQLNILDIFHVNPSRLAPTISAACRVTNFAPIEFVDQNIGDTKRTLAKVTYTAQGNTMLIDPLDGKVYVSEPQSEVTDELARARVDFMLTLASMCFMTYCQFFGIPQEALFESSEYRLYFPLNVTSLITGDNQEEQVTYNVVDEFVEANREKLLIATLRAKAQLLKEGSPRDAR
jgi:hypothetical protein